MYVTGQELPPIVVGNILLFLPTADVIVAQIHGERQFLVHTC